MHIYIFLLLIYFVTSPLSTTVLAKNNSDKTLASSEELEIWRLKKQNLSKESRKDLDRAIEKYDEIKEKEKNANKELVQSKNQLADFNLSRKDEISKETEKLEQRIKRAQKKVDFCKKNLENAENKLNESKKNFDFEITKFKDKLQNKEEKLKKEITQKEKKYEKSKENTKKAKKEFDEVKVFLSK
ncbi:MAG: hypothetical protein PHY73_04380 [Candidatus Omnitrophica bacterium]|nr:hypothetical protein [Candidatus Omnitrophota bacterium]